MKSFYIANRLIGPDAPPFVIAELSGNHGQDLAVAKEMVCAAAEAGADAIKLQTYTADSMTLDCESDEFLISEAESLWRGEKLYDLYAKAATPYEWHETLFNLAREKGLLAFSSPFDDHAVDFLDELGVPCFKIASFELTDLPLIKKVASKRKPMILSTGMASFQETQDALVCARENGAEDIVLLKCTSTYPASPAQSNLVTVPHMAAGFGCQVGLSDHTAGIGVAVGAVALGATVIEKHFVLDRQAGGVDAAFSLEPSELGALCTETKRAWQALGRVCYGGCTAEKEAKRYRRSIYVKRDVAAGERVTKDNIAVVRPAYGLAPRHYETVLGKTFRVSIRKGTALSWQHL